MNQLPRTRWSLIEQAANGTTRIRRQALQELLATYLPALQGHLRLRYKLAPEAAEDTVQSFVAERVLEKQLLQKADQDAGRFRGFLFKSLRNHFLTQVRKPNNQLLEFELNDQLDSPEEQRNDDIFDLLWARQVLLETLRRMKEECYNHERVDRWGVFTGRVLLASLQGSAKDYDDLVLEYEIESHAKASNILMTAKRMFARIESEVIAEFCSEGQEIEEERKHFHAVLSRADILSHPEFSELLRFETTTGVQPADQTEVSSAQLGQLSQILDLSQGAKCSDEDLGLLLRGQLERRLANLLPPEDQPDPRQTLETLERALLNANSDLRAIRAIGNEGQRLVHKPDGLTPSRVGAALYLLAESAAVSHHGSRVADSDPAKLLQGLQSMQGKAWIGAKMQTLMQSAAERLQTSRT